MRPKRTPPPPTVAYEITSKREASGTKGSGETCLTSQVSTADDNVASEAVHTAGSRFTRTTVVWATWEQSEELDSRVCVFSQKTESIICWREGVSIHPDQLRHLWI